MLLSVTTNNYLSPKSKINNVIDKKNYLSPSSALKFNNVDSVQFTGKSMPSMYSTTFEYLSSEILGRTKKYQIDGSLLSASKIKIALQKIFDKGLVYFPYKYADKDKIKWKSYIPNDIRSYSIDKINEARKVRLDEWKSFLEKPNSFIDSKISYHRKLINKVDGNKSLKLVIWDAITSELKENNRHIPVPLNAEALYETIKDFENVDPKLRAVRCVKPSFLDIYTHRLRDNLLMDMKLSNNDSVWVKIPSIKHDKANKSKNIEALEILSYKNWCTRSSVDKAEDALLDGDFYLYLERDTSQIWHPLAAMTTSKGQIDQIQGMENNNIIPISLVDKIKNYIQSNKLSCRSAVLDEGPKAHQQLMISEKLAVLDPILKKNFYKAIKENDDFAIFRFLGIRAKCTEDGLLEISTYKPIYSLDSKKGISVPYAMFGISEESLLRNVKVINGNFVLYNKNKLLNSYLKNFPAKLEKVTGHVECTRDQYKMFEQDILRVVGNDKNKIIIHG